MKEFARLLLVASAALCLSAQSGGSSPTADGVVQQYLLARGGLASIVAVRTLVMHGTYSEGAQGSEPADMTRMRPNLRIVGDPRAHDEILEGFDNGAWEYYADPGIVLRTVGPAEASSRRGAEFDDPLVNYRAKGHTVELLGIENIAGHSAYRLHVTLNDGAELDKLVDVTGGILIAERRSVPQHAFGRSVSTQTLIGDYIRVAGVLYPTTFREAEIATGKVLNALRWTSIEANVALDPSIFSPPAFQRTPLQRLLQKIYDDRFDTNAALRAYRDFRASPQTAGINTEHGIEVVGYQCVKMSAFVTALALLRANAADYPSSAAAQFGLGRALQAAAEPAEAAAAYRAAIHADPEYSRAKDALAALER